MRRSSGSALRPLMWCVERAISTPSTHHMHHGQHADDGGTYCKGNHGNPLCFCDVVFGTSCITRRYAASHGIENLGEQPWQVELAWPLVTPLPESSQQASEQREVGPFALETKAPGRGPRATRPSPGLPVVPCPARVPTPEGKKS
jgi:hypothetical protein